MNVRSEQKSLRLGFYVFCRSLYTHCLHVESSSGPTEIGMAGLTGVRGRLVRTHSRDHLAQWSARPVGVPGWTTCWGGEPELRAQVNANAIRIIGERLIEENVQLLDVSWEEERLKAMKPPRENRGRDRDRQAERIPADPGGRRRTHHLPRNREGTGFFSVRSRQQRGRQHSKS